MNQFLQPNERNEHETCDSELLSKRSYIVNGNRKFNL